MFCPDCHSEYREGITQCAECEIDLVDHLPLGLDDLEIVPVLRTTNQPLLAAFRSALRAAEIPHIVRGDEAASLMPLNATVVVAKDNYETARQILRDAESDHEPAEDESSST